MSEPISIAAPAESGTSNEKKFTRLVRWEELVWQIVVKTSVAIPGLFLGVIAGWIIALTTGLIQFEC